MNDRELDALIARAALVTPAPARGPADKPADPAAAALRRGRYELLEEIMTSPPEAPLTTPVGGPVTTDLGAGFGAPGPSRRHRLSRGKRWAAGIAVAAAFAAAVAVPTVVFRGGGDDVKVQDSNASARAAAETSPRVLIDDPVWKIDHVDQDARYGGEVQFTSGTQSLQATWYPAKDYQSCYDDRLDVSAPEKFSVLGREGELFTYSSSDFAVLMPVDGKWFVEYRVGVKNRAALDIVMAKLKEVSVDEWLAAMPSSVVGPGEEAAVAAQMLDGVPLPPGFDASTLVTGNANDYYQFGALVTSKVACGWLDLYEKARNTEDDAAMVQADQALATSKQWKVLLTMEPKGAWSDVLWEYADKVHARKAAGDYRQGLGCK